MKKITLVDLVFVAGMLGFLWLVASFIDINAHNLTDCQYKAWNLFVLLF